MMIKSLKRFDLWNIISIIFLSYKHQCTLSYPEFANW